MSYIPIGVIMSEKVQFVMSDEAIAIVNECSTARKRGEWLSKAALNYAAFLKGLESDGTDRGALEKLDARTVRIEQKLDMISGKGKGE